MIVYCVFREAGDAYDAGDILEHIFLDKEKAETFVENASYGYYVDDWETE